MSPGRAGAGTRYAYRVYGPNEPDSGARFDPAVALLDPYTRALSLDEPWRSCVVDPSFEWDGDRPPATPWRDTVIYELHVKGYTRLHPLVPPDERGRYLGLATQPVIAHLKSLGVTAVELLPIQSFASERFLLERGLSNYWGYNSVAWFAPANEYAQSDAVREFKTMIRALHRADIEVILDVVFNHTAEGNETGPVLNLKGIDNAVYYRLQADKRHYENLTGCGNTVNCEHPAVRSMIIDCLRYWVEDMHVDGFRFDLATVLGRESHGFNEHVGVLRRAACRALARVCEADRRALGCRARRISARPIPRRASASGTTATATRCVPSGAVTAGASASWRSVSPDRATSFGTMAESPPPASTS